MRRVVVLFALTGCSAIFGLHDPTHGTVVDGPPSDVPDGRTPDASMCVGHGALAVCFDTLPTMSTQLPPSITTSDDAQCSTTAHWVDAAQPTACFITGTDIVQSGTTVVDGTRPLVLVALGSLEVTGSIDASSHVGVTGTGPGADPAACPAFAGAAQPNANGGGGASGTDGGVGNPGSDPNPLDPLVAAPGGAGTRGGPGGAGAAGTMAAADGGVSGGGNVHSGGGGGGGIGMIYAPTTLGGATVSPAVTPLP
jgi:hypothetical protein